MNKRILLVEDQDFEQDFVRKSLQGLELDLVIASDYGEGMRALREGPYDLLILDNRLKDISGASIELLQAAHRFMESVPPAFVHSSYLNPEERRQVEALGAEYFPKGGSYAAFRTEVLRHLET